MKGQRGFTLVEVLVALGIFGILSAAAVGIIRIATNAQEQAEEVSASLAGIERMRAVIRADMLQVTARPFGEPNRSGLTGPAVGGITAQTVIEKENPGEDILFAFVRNGWSNPGHRLPRASLQQVTYLTDGQSLIRRVRPFIDAVDATPYRDEVLIDGVSGVVIEFDSPNGWQDDLRADAALANLRAIRLRMTHPDFGELTQLFLVGEGS